MTGRILMICSAAPRRPAFPADELPSATALQRIGRLPIRGLCLASPLLRACQTAAALGLDPVTEPALAELDYGRWRGLTPEAVHASDPEGFAAWLGDPHARPHGGESIAELAERVAGWLAAQAGAEQDIIAISHPGPIQAAIVHVLNAPLMAARHVSVKPLSRLRLSHDGRRWAISLEP